MIRPSAISAALVAATNALTDDSHPPANAYDDDTEYVTSFGFNPLPALKTRQKSFVVGSTRR
jgi:hypothetical protein